MSSLAMVAVACQDKKELEPSVNPAKPGSEVEFGAAIDESAISRTIYDPTEYKSEEGAEDKYHYLDIEWLGDDEMLIASPHAAQGRHFANYKVNHTLFDAEDKWSSSKQGGPLERTSEVGVQWGSTDPHDFYSIQPQRE